MRPNPSVQDQSTPAAATGPIKLQFPQFDREIVAKPGETIFQSARRNGLRVVGACGGRGACGTCTVQIMEGEVQHADGRLLGPRPARHGQEARGRWVRACQVVPKADCTIEVEQRSLAPVVRAEPEARGGETLPLEAMVTASISRWLPRASKIRCPTRTACGARPA
jgi:ferredoxin